MADRLTAKLQERVVPVNRALRQIASAEAAPERWSVDAFVRAGLLEVGDIVLYAREGNLLSKFVKWATGSQFSHAGMVYYTPNHDHGFEHHFIIEADQNGIDLTPLRYYLDDPAVTIAILRVANRSAWLDDTLRKDMRGRLMETIADGYNFGAIEHIAVESIKATLFGLRSMVRGSATTLAAIRETKPATLPHAFICSGLVQVGYTFACLQAIRRGDIPAESLADSVFRNDLLEWFEPQWSHYTAEGKIARAGRLFQTFVGDLEATTPADIARSENLDWHYLCRRGRVYRVRSQAEAERVIAAGR